MKVKLIFIIDIGAICVGEATVLALEIHAVFGRSAIEINNGVKDVVGNSVTEDSREFESGCVFENIDIFSNWVEGYFYTICRWCHNRMRHCGKLTVLSDNDDALKLQLKDMDLEFSWPVRKIKEVLPQLGSTSGSSPSSCSLETTKAIASLVEELNLPEANTGLASGISVFLWLYTSIHGDKPAKAVMTSDLPLGSGLGSSAAFCVALSAALLALTDFSKLDFSNQGWQVFGDSELELVNKCAFEGEKIIHGRPSRIDNTVSTYGNMIKFRSGELTCIKTNMPLKMLITNTKVGRNTKALVAGVSERTMLISSLKFRCWRGRKQHLGSSAW